MSIPKGARRWVAALAVYAVVVTGVAAVSLLGAVGVSDSQSGEPTSTGADRRPTAAPVDHLVIDGADLMALPTRGSAWSALLEVAQSDPGSIDLEDQDNVHAGRLLAAALVYGRTGEKRYQTEVQTALSELPQAELDDARVLSVGRQLAGYVVAADLVGYRDPEFMEYVGEMRTYEIGGHDRWTTLTNTSENTASNWGAWALTSRIAISAYLDDTTDLKQAAKIFRGFTGDRGAHDDFQKTDDFDPSWSCDPARWQPINPPSCGDRSGAIVEDISRSKGSYPEVNENGRTYSWETLGGATLSAELLSHAGYPDVWTWGDDALLRAAEFLQRFDGYPPSYSTNQYIPWVINDAYDADLGPVQPAGYGRQYGYSDWLAASEAE